MLESWAERAGLDLPAKGHDIVHGWGDMEVVYDVRHDETGFSLVWRDRASDRTVATFGTQDEADALLLSMLGRAWLSTQGVRPGAGTAPASGTTIDSVDGNYRVTDAAGRVSIFSSRNDAIWYSRFAGMSAQEVEAWLTAQLPA